ncbi:MAG: hypothetical protein KDI82_08750 [Gammaproteobacteria bacterium]|nr:hypothetical protein [Gammaproteobacteria bacterium]
MTPKDHAIAWWGDDSYPAGEDWNALLRQFALSRDQACDEALQDVMKIVDEPDLGEAVRQRIEALKSG